MNNNNNNNNDITSNINSNNNIKSGHIKIGSYDILGTIGHGNFSVCKLALNRTTNIKVIILIKNNIRRRLI